MNFVFFFISVFGCLIIILLVGLIIPPLIALITVGTSRVLGGDKFAVVIATPMFVFNELCRYYTWILLASTSVLLSDYWSSSTWVYVVYAIISGLVTFRAWAINHSDLLKRGGFNNAMVGAPLQIIHSMGMYVAVTASIVFGIWPELARQLPFNFLFEFYLSIIT